MVIGKDKRYFDRDFKYETIRLMDEGKRSYLFFLHNRILKNKRNNIM